jgi:hypothetical protein
LDYSLDYEIHEIILVALFLLFLGINIVDYLSTIIGLARGFIETNWLVNQLTPRISEIPSLILVKASFSLLIGGTIWLALKESPRSFIDDDAMIVSLIFLNVIGFFTLSNNFSYLGWRI